MKRFYREATVEPVGRGFEIRLDSRPIKTPARAPLVSPNRALAEAIKEEWGAQADEVKPQTMPLTQLLNTAIDRIGTQRPQIVEMIAAYGETDLLCYRAERETELARRQAALWQPLLDWAVARYDAPLRFSVGVMPTPQPKEAVQALRTAIERLDDLALTALQAATAACGSLVVALALVDGHIDAEEAFRISQLDELFQAEKWGEDEAAADRRAVLKAEIAAARRFLDLARD